MYVSKSTAGVWFFLTVFNQGSICFVVNQLLYLRSDYYGWQLIPYSFHLPFIKYIVGRRLSHIPQFLHRPLPWLHWPLRCCREQGQDSLQWHGYELHSQSPGGRIRVCRLWHPYPHRYHLHWCKSSRRTLLECEQDNRSLDRGRWSCLQHQHPRRE